MNNFRNFINETYISDKNIEDYHNSNNDVPKEDKPEKTDAEYFDEVNPDTKTKYDIPNLSFKDNNYFFEYVRFMKMKENNPEQFKKIMSWS